MFVSAVVAALYALSLVMPKSDLAILFPVGLISAVVAGVTFIASLVLYLKPPAKAVGISTFVAYALLVATIASVIISTGESNSPFIGLWIAVGVFAGVFGWKGFALILLLVVGYDAYAYLRHISPESMIIATVASVAPLIASFIIWHSRSSKEVEQAKAYKELASELSHEANKSDTVINAINDGVISVDKQGVIQLINPAAQRIIGWGQEDAVGLSYKSVIKLNDKSDKPITPEVDPVQQVLVTEQEVHSEDFSITTEAGKKVLLSLIVSPIGRPSTGAIMVFRDMTKEKSEEREQAEFISTASHEMRTPVASIEGYLGLVLNPATATIDEKTRDYVQKAQASAQHLGRLFQDLLDVSKAEDGRMSNDPSVVDVVEFVGEVSEGLKQKAIEKGLRFLYKPMPEGDTAVRQIAPVYYAHVDNDHLREVIANLVENAIKYTPQGDVIIDVGGDETKVTISVQDSGIGIPTEDIPHLFQKFYRVDNSDTREIGGTGLGLYLCRRLAELMGGQIRVESEYKKGSIFYLDLPRIDHTEAERLMEAATAAKEMANEASQAQPVVTPTMPFTPSPPVIAPQPAPQPLVQPVPLAPAPQPVQSVQPITPQPPSSVPLSQIEQNPTVYTQPRPPIQIPVRGPADPNQP
jgi:PAS domain S-box-containing protein